MGKFNLKKNKFFVVLIFFFLLLLLVSGFLAYHFISKSDTSTSDYEDMVNIITKIDYTERQDALNQIVEEGMINICYSTNTVFNGKVSESFNVQNSVNNHNDLVFEIFDKNDNSIYKSKKIKPGYELNFIELQKPLSKGRHECKIKIGYASEGNVSSMFPLIVVVK